MELQQLKYFITVAKLEHFSAAAEELNISQPALSLTIRRLEHELGVSLFEKSGRNVRLSSYGKYFLSKVQPAYEQLMEAASIMSTLKQKDSGRIFIYGPPLFSFPNLMQQISLLCPQTGMKNVEAPADEALANLKSGRGDFALLFTQPSFVPNPSFFDYKSFPRHDLVLLMPEKHLLARCQQVSFAQLSGAPLATYPTGTNLRPMLEQAFSDQNCYFDAAFESNLIFDQIALVRNGMALALLPRHLLSLHNLKDLTFRPVTPSLPYNICLVWAKTVSSKSSFQVLCDTLSAYFCQDDI